MRTSHEIVVLAVKPQYYDAVLKNIKYAVKPEQIVISIAPGITIDSLVKKLGDGKRIVRAMPNTPALLGEGMTGVTYDRGAVFTGGRGTGDPGIFPVLWRDRNTWRNG